MPCHLRLAQPIDLAAIVAIYNGSIPGRMATADLEPVSVDTRRDWFASHQSENCPIWVVESAGQVVGWAALSDFYGRAAYAGTREIAVYVSTEAQGQGLARRLVQTAIHQATQSGLHTLVAYVFSHNEPSLRLFQRCGFNQWGHCPNIARLDGEPRSLNILGLTLNAPGPSILDQTGTGQSIN